jgi:hypothetical protein
VLQQPLGCKICRSDVGVETECLAEGEETLFGTDGANTPFGAADGAWRTTGRRRRSRRKTREGEKRRIERNK